MLKSLHLLVGGLLLSHVVLAQNTLRVDIEVAEIGYIWLQDEEAGIGMNIVASSPIDEIGGAPLPIIEANLADYDYLEFVFTAPEGMRFFWNPSDGEGGYFDAIPNILLNYGYSSIEVVEVESVNLAFIDYEGYPMPSTDIFGEMGVDGSGLSIMSCGCIDTPSGPAYFTGMVLTIDYSNIVDRTGWIEDIFDPYGFVAFSTYAEVEEDPGPSLSLVPVPEPGMYAALLGAGVMAFVIGYRRSRA